MSKTILFTGGGSAGHVTGNLVLIEKCTQANWSIHYIGSEQGIEKTLIADYKDVTYHAIATGKLRRYFTWENVTDIFKVLKGITQSYRLIKEIKPHIVFSKGGFVSVPVVLGARLNRVPVIIHEPDLNVGLANQLSLPFATRMSTAFQETAERYDVRKTVYVGPILKDGFQLIKNDNLNELDSDSYVAKKPVLLIMGGSQGAQGINQMVAKALPALLAKFHVIHICGKGKVEHSVSMLGYQPYEYVTSELPELLVRADIVVSRAGSNSILELLSLQKPMLLIPHTHGGSRSGQLAHARYFEQAGFADTLLEEQMTADSFVSTILRLYENRKTYKDAMKKHKTGRGADKIMELIKEVSHHAAKTKVHL